MDQVLGALAGFFVLFLVAFGMHWLMRGESHKYSPDKSKQNLAKFKTQQKKRD